MMCSSSGAKLASLSFAPANIIKKKMLRRLKLIGSLIQPRAATGRSETLDPFIKPPPTCPLRTDGIDSRGDSAVKPDGEPDKNEGGGKGGSCAHARTP